jgi:uncharacterized membrane protein YdjX (TVP38/TMEM64 family)
MGRLLRVALVLAVVVAAVLALRALGIDGSITVEGMRGVLAPWGAWGPALFVAVCVLGFLLQMPPGMLVATGGLLFGGVSAFAYTWIAAVIGTTLTFLFVRYVARDAVARRLGLRFERFRRLDARFAAHGFRMVVLLRLALFLAPPVNWAIGATSVSLGSYVAGTALGIVPGIAATVYLADSIAEAQSYEDLLTPQILAAAAFFGALIVIAAVLGRRLFALPPEV